ncbi:MAG: RNA-binding protein [Chitinophagales bacterium]|nr:RNA-binding protein [Chitinophagaceae bacterium]MCB9064255.1 RNA-binding protein [Chitinophagales bacterium]
MVQAGSYYKLRVVKKVSFGIYLDADGTEVLMPTRFVPQGVQEEDEIEVFIYHDNDGRLIATSQKPYGQVGDIVMLQVKDKTKQGAFMDWGLMKDIFLPLSQQRSPIRVGGKYLVYIYLDEQTGRVAASEYVSRYLDNEHLTVDEHDEVDLVIWRKTDIGYSVVINGKHEGMLHDNEIFRDLDIGAKEKGFIKSIQEDGKINVSLGKKGYGRISDEAEKILSLLKENNGYLPYHDKSDPDDIYEFFKMSKKAFKMAVGSLYKQKIIELTKTGIKAVDH